MTIEDSLSLNPNQCHYPLITYLTLAQDQAVILEAVILDEPNVRNALTNDDFEIALINSNENNFLLQDFANELAKEVIGDILTTPFNHCDTNHDVLFDYSSYLQDKHDSYKADDTDIFAEVKAIETGITLLIDKTRH